MKLKFYFLFIFILACNCALAQVPGTLSYQGLLTDNSGNPVADGTSVVTFNFYNIATGGTSVLTRGPVNVTTSKGLFTTVLGDGTTNNAALPGTLFGAEFWIGITVGVGGTELTPRVRITAVPYAYRAQVANTLDGGAIVAGAQIGAGINASNITAGTLPAAQIATGSIDNTKLASGIDASKITTGTLTINSQTPSSPVAGQVRYNATEKVMEFYNGADWYFMVPKVAFIKDAKVGGTEGGSSVSGDWKSRDLNVITGDKSFVALVSSTIFSLTAGEYYLEASAPAFYSDRHKLRLYNKTDLTDQIGSLANGLWSNSMGTSQYNASGVVVTRSELVSSFAIATQKSFEIQHFFVSGFAGQGLGVAFNGTGFAEIYTQVKITKLR
jgi:hypothetical protein